MRVAVECYVPSALASQDEAADDLFRFVQAVSLSDTRSRGIVDEVVAAPNLATMVVAGWMTVAGY